MGDATTLAVRELGTGPPLLLLNGYAATKDDWDPAFLDALAAMSTVICPDHAGVGESPPAAGELSIASMAVDALAVLDAHGIATADLAGWSMGGFVAQQIAATAPDRIRRLALLSTDPGGTEALIAAADAWDRLVDHGGTPREQATRLLSLLFPPGVAEGIDAEFGEVVATARGLLSPLALTAQARAMNRWHVEPADQRIAGIAAPALIAAGALDEVIPPANSERLHEALAGSELEIFDGCGHAFMAQEPQRLGEMINAWLGR